MGLSTVQATISTEFKWLVSNNLTGSNYNPTQNTGDIRKNYNCGTAAANAASGGCDEAMSFQQAIAGGGTATIDLNAMTNLLQIAAVAIVRIKGYQIRLLNLADDPTITSPVASQGLVTNIGPPTPSPLDFQNGGSGLTVTLTATGAVTAVAIGAAGTGYPASSCFLASPVQMGGSGCVFAVVTNGSGVPTSVVFIAGAGGAGYTGATVPTVAVGQYVINSGGAHLYLDPLAAGFCPVSSTQKKILLVNNDPVNTASYELDFLPATS